MTKPPVFDTGPREFPILIIPDHWKTGIHPRVLRDLSAYFNDRVLSEHSFLRALLCNQLGEAFEAVTYLTLFSRCEEGREWTYGDDRRDSFMVWQTYWLCSQLAPERAWGSPAKVKAWLDGKYRDWSNARLFEPISTDHLDTLLDRGYPSEALIGRLVDWHGAGPHRLGLWGERLRLKIKLTCRCEKSSIDFYVHSGLHSGAWCYGTDAQGNFANLRDQEYICSACASKRKE